MDCGGVVERALAEAGKQLRLVIPCGEVERRVERAPQTRERILIAVDRLGRAGFEAGPQIRRFRDGGRSRSPSGQRLQRQPSQTAGRAVHQNLLSFLGRGEDDMIAAHPRLKTGDELAVYVEQRSPAASPPQIVKWVSV